MIPKRLLLGFGGALAFGLLAAGAQAASPGQFASHDKSPQTNNLLTPIRHGGGGWGGGRGWGGGGHWGGGHWGGGRRFAVRRGFRGGGFYGYGYGYGGCFWYYGRLVCPGYGYGGYPYY
jgi:hypothetical protein